MTAEVIARGLVYSSEVEGEQNEDSSEGAGEEAEGTSVGRRDGGRVGGHNEACRGRVADIAGGLRDLRVGRSIGVLVDSSSDRRSELLVELVSITADLLELASEVAGVCTVCRVGGSGGQAACRDVALSSQPVHILGVFLEEGGLFGELLTIDVSRGVLRVFAEDRSVGAGFYTDSFVGELVNCVSVSDTDSGPATNRNGDIFTGLVDESEELVDELTIGKEAIGDIEG